MTKVHIDVAGLENLRRHALSVGKLEQWSEIALQWMRAAEAEITQLKTSKDAEEKADRIRILKDIWDDGEDHHPPRLLAREGEVLNVLETLPTGYGVARNGQFFVGKDECEVVKWLSPQVNG